MDEMERCTICPRECGVNRNSGQPGYCGMTAKMKIARAALHFWEEPCISGKEGSGTVFFTGCNLGCVFCQNHEISFCCNEPIGKEVEVEELVAVFFELKNKGANNINLVTPTHFVPQIAEALGIAKKNGLSIPILYNTSGYEKVETLKMLEGLVDIYLPDLKYISEKNGAEFSNAEDYFHKAAPAIDEMVRQVGDCQFDQRGMIQKGVIVRHLILPGYTKESCNVIQYLYETYQNRIYISIMNQYTPFPRVEKYFPKINRKVTKREYEKVIQMALDLGIVNGFIQEGKTAEKSFVPDFRIYEN